MNAPTWQIHEGDALALLRSLPTASVDGLVTDNPYSSGGMVRGDRMLGTKVKYSSTDSGQAEACDDFAGDTRDQRSFAYWCALWLAEALRVGRPAGVAVVFTDWRQLPSTTDALQAGGWVWRGIVPWEKPVSRPCLGRFTNACEYVVWGSNGPLPFDRGVGALPGFYRHSSPRDREHITQKPVPLMVDLLEIIPPGGIVLDPFCGSGTTGIAAVSTGRSFIGCEIVPSIAASARARVAIAAGARVTRSEQQALL
jgi:site-specific DNA-methyltransferase (adenine-specific)